MLVPCAFVLVHVCEGMCQRVQPGHLGVTGQPYFGLAESSSPQGGGQTGSAVSPPAEHSHPRLCRESSSRSYLHTPLNPEFSVIKCQSLEGSWEII